MASTTVDGRTARSRRTRDAVVRALLALVTDGNPRPTAKEIAARAGVSLRSVYVHFDDLDDLFTATIREHLQTNTVVVEPIDETLPLGARVDAFVRRRAAVFEQAPALRRAARLWAPTSTALRDALAHAQTLAWRETLRLFGAAVPAGRDRTARLEALNAAASVSTWDLLRLGRRLSVAEARHVVVVTVTSILEVS